MIRWCCYCQEFLGEKPPYGDPRFSHGICAACDMRLVRDSARGDFDALMKETVPRRVLVERIIASASQGDEVACRAVLAEARALGLSSESMLLGLLQPALYQAGRDWQGGQMSVTAEHRLTTWCERVFDSISVVVPPTRPIDLLIFQAPGNAHTLGPRVASRILAARGLSVDIIIPELPFDEMVTLAREICPRIIGLSCALPAQVPVASRLLTCLRARLEPAVRCRYVLAGFAFRDGEAVSPPPVDHGIEVAVDLEYFGT